MLLVNITIIKSIIWNIILRLPPTDNYLLKIRPDRKKWSFIKCMTLFYSFEYETRKLLKGVGCIAANFVPSFKNKVNFEFWIRPVHCGRVHSWCCYVFFFSNDKCFNYCWPFLYLEVHNTFFSWQVYCVSRLLHFHACLNVPVWSSGLRNIRSVVMITE